MKQIKLHLILIALVIFALGCNKLKKDDGPACEINETTKITFNNTGSGALRIEVATQFDAKYNAIDPVLVFDLVPGAVSVKEIRRGKYFIQWKANCATACTQQAFYAKTFEMCQEYTETQ